MGTLEPKDHGEAVALFRSEVVGALTRLDLPRASFSATHVDFRRAFCATERAACDICGGTEHEPRFDDKYVHRVAPVEGDSPFRRSIAGAHGTAEPRTT